MSHRCLFCLLACIQIVDVGIRCTGARRSGSRAGVGCLVCTLCLSSVDFVTCLSEWEPWESPCMMGTKILELHRACSVHKTCMSALWYSPTQCEHGHKHTRRRQVSVRGLVVSIQMMYHVSRWPFPV